MFKKSPESNLTQEEAVRLHESLSQIKRVLYTLFGNSEPGAEQTTALVANENYGAVVVVQLADALRILAQRYGDPKPAESVTIRSLDDLFQEFDRLTDSLGHVSADFHVGKLPRKDQTLVHGLREMAYYTMLALQAHREDREGSALEQALAAHYARRTGAEGDPTPESIPTASSELALDRVTADSPHMAALQPAREYPTHSELASRNVFEAWVGHVGTKADYLNEVAGLIEGGSPSNKRRIRNALAGFLREHGPGFLHGERIQQLLGP
jgi:hypothetical protein